MAHYVRSITPAVPPGRPPGPEQPWTGWWQPSTDDEAAMSGVGVLDTAGRDVPHAAEPQRPDRPNTEFRDASIDRPANPSAGVEAMDRAGLRRVGVPPSGAPIDTAAAAAADGATADPALPGHWAVLETAATRELDTRSEAASDADFTIEGVAQRTGDLVFVGVTFPEPLAVAPDPSAIRLTIVGAANADLESVAVAPFDGFAPDRIGFTLIAAALNPGAMWVDGHYHVGV